MVKCLECKNMKITTGYHYDSHDCMHPSCFETKIEDQPCFTRAMYGEHTRSYKVRVKNFEEMNCNNNCEFFIKKRSLLDNIKDMFPW